jgi:hypothetical protein
MPHFKCIACKTRLYSPADPVDPVGDLCPGCGSLLEPVGELSEIVGFRSIDAERWLDDGSFSPEAVAEAVALPRPQEK